LNKGSGNFISELLLYDDEETAIKSFFNFVIKVLFARQPPESLSAANLFKPFRREFTHEKPGANPAAFTTTTLALLWCFFQSRRPHFGSKMHSITCFVEHKLERWRCNPRSEDWFQAIR
jgi:hypothetical protein